MTMMTSYEIACVSPEWCDYTCAIMLAFDEICRSTKAVNYGVTFTDSRVVYGAIFKICGEEGDAEVIAQRLRQRFPECRFAINPADYDAFWKSLHTALDAKYTQKGVEVCDAGLCKDSPEKKSKERFGGCVSRVLSRFDKGPNDKGA